MSAVLRELGSHPVEHNQSRKDCAGGQEGDSRISGQADKGIGLGAGELAGVR